MGPRKRRAVAFFLAALGVYWPLSSVAEPAVRTLWFQTVVRALAQDAQALRPAPDTLWLGASRPELPHSLHGIYELEKSLGRPLQLVSFYQAWGDGPEHQFPDQTLRSLRKAGYVPMVTWEPWLNAFSQWHGQKPQGALRIIADGAVDDYIRQWAREAVRFGSPLFLRPAHEPTNPWYAWAESYGNTASDQRAFWQHVRQIFRDEGARNVQFVWTPYGLEELSWFPAGNADWIGFDIFNFGSLSEQGVWLDFYSITKLFYDTYKDLGVPLMIAETATASAGGNKTDWIRDMFLSLSRGNFPEIKAVILFDHPRGQTETGLPLDWSFAETPEALQLLRETPELLTPFVRKDL